MELKDSTRKYMTVLRLRRWYVDQHINPDEQLHYGQLPILESIARNPGCNQMDLAKEFSVSRASITKSIKRMIKQGVIMRKEHPEDKRKFELYATDRGISIAENRRRIFDEIDKKAFIGFKEEEIECLNGFLDRMIDNLSADYLRDKSTKQTKKGKEND